MKKKNVAIAMVALLLLFILLYFHINIPSGKDKKNENNDIPLKADAGPDKFVWISEVVVFDGSNSTGNIVKYIWDFDRNDTPDGTLNDDAIGPVVTHKYTIAREYRVTLTVVDSEGKTSRDFLIVHVSLKIEDEGTLSMNDNKNYTFDIYPGADKFYAILIYPSSSIGNPYNDMNMYLNSPNSTVCNTVKDKREPGDTQKEEMLIDDARYLVPFGEWNVGVSCTLGRNVDYRISIYVYY